MGGGGVMVCCETHNSSCHGMLKIWHDYQLGDCWRLNNIINNAFKKNPIREETAEGEQPPCWASYSTFKAAKTGRQGQGQTNKTNLGWLQLTPAIKTCFFYFCFSHINLDYPMRLKLQLLQLRVPHQWCFKNCTCTFNHCASISKLFLTSATPS